MMKYSTVVSQMKASPIRAMMVKAAAMEGVISLSPGEPDFIPEESVLKAAAEHLSNSSTYAPGAGFHELRDVYTAYLNKEIGTDYKRENVMVTVGGMSAVFLCLGAILDPGDEVMVCAPYFLNYEGMIQMQQGVPVEVMTAEENGFQVTADDIEKCITDKTKVLILNSPCNPTGQVMSKEELDKIAALALKHNFFVLSDEVYRSIIYDGAKAYSIAQNEAVKDRVIIVDSCSKSSAMAGFRVGFLVGPEELITLATKATENVYSSTTSVSQYAAIEALKNGEAYRKLMCAEYEKRRNYLCERIAKMPKISCRKPQGAFYLFVNVKETGLTDWEFAEQLLEKQKVAIVPGSAFGKNAEGYVRISYATSMENLQEAFDRIEKFVTSL